MIIEDQAVSPSHYLAPRSPIPLPPLSSAIFFSLSLSSSSVSPVKLADGRGGGGAKSYDGETVFLYQSFLKYSVGTY
jgi:hypothetical protein